MVADDANDRTCGNESSIAQKAGSSERAPKEFTAYENRNAVHSACRHYSGCNGPAPGGQFRAPYEQPCRDHRFGWAGNGFNDQAATGAGVEDAVRIHVSQCDSRGSGEPGIRILRPPPDLGVF